MSIKNVTLIGASGNLGRADSSATFPDGTKVVRSDYSPESLTQALMGQDAVVSMITITALAEQQKVANAAIAAGVKLFLPSEFGSDTASDAVIAAVPFFKPKKDFIDFLAANEAKMSWAAIVTGPFFDWGLTYGLTGFDVANKTATLVDGGKARFSATNVVQIARSIIAVLEHPDIVANRFVYVESFSTNQLEVLAALEKATGEKWQVKYESSDDLRTVGFQKFQEGDLVTGGTNIIKATILGEGSLEDHSHVAGGIWNERLGLPKEDVDEVVKKVLSS
ncbi:isoflavone reductase family protein [Botryosphaeria dothidea]|uniref:Isoflavone reductase family protein n=1 Tax=Botryosphaeria dothidea TaxID=55169 RepID=A0A8H4N2V2_9PEZI|nr:isoflavone reductase family protein [Botryosphaeria dothidea]